MESIKDHQRRIEAAAKVDQFFSDYEIEMELDEVLSFIAATSHEDVLTECVYRLVDALNRMIPRVDFGPTHPQTGSIFHKFHIGRRHGNLLLILDIFKGYLEPSYSVDDLAESMKPFVEKAGCAFHSEGGEDVHQFTFLWPVRDRN